MLRAIGTIVSLGLIIVTYMMWDGRFGPEFTAPGKFAYPASLFMFAMMLGWVSMKSKDA